MSQSSYNLLKDIEILLMSNIDDKDVYNELVSRISFIFNEYDIEKKSTELSVYTDENIRILNRYKACLLVEGKATSTIEQYDYRLTHMFNTLNINFKDIGPYDIRFYIALLKQKGCSNRTLETIRTYISAFYKWMFTEGMIENNPCAPIKPIKYADEVRESFSELDIEKLRATCKNLKERAIVELLLSSGIRVSECSSLNRQDIDFRNCVIHVKHGKGDKERITYMSPVAAYYIGEYVDSRTDDEEYLFRDKKGGRLQPGGIRWILKDLGERSGVDNCHPHRFRRTFATSLNTKGMAIQYIQHLLGHSKIDTTMIYVSVNENAVKSEYLKYTSA